MPQTIEIATVLNSLEMRQLEAEINYHWVCYQLDKPVIDDSSYDVKVKLLYEMAKHYPDVSFTIAPQIVKALSNNFSNHMATFTLDESSQQVYEMLLSDPVFRVTTIGTMLLDGDVDLGSFITNNK